MESCNSFDWIFTKYFIEISNLVSIPYSNIASAAISLLSVCCLQL